MTSLGLLRQCPCAPPAVIGRNPDNGRKVQARMFPNWSSESSCLSTIGSSEVGQQRSIMDQTARLHNHKWKQHSFRSHTKVCSRYHRTQTQSNSQSLLEWRGIPGRTLPIRPGNLLSPGPKRGFVHNHTELSDQQV